VASVIPIHPSSELVPLAGFSLNDLEVTRLMLRGSSCVDWVRLNFESDEEIEAFLRVNEFDLSHSQDRSRLSRLQSKAVTYLETHLKYRISQVVKAAPDIRALIRFASQTKGRRSHRFFACLLLKVMHIIHHVEARELLSKLPVSEAELATLVQAKIERTVRGLLERDFPVVDFLGSQKRTYSVYSKLLAKKNTQAAQILDKLRFRIIVERLEDLPSLVLALSRELIPFCYVVPGQTHNSLVDLHRLLIRAGHVISYDKPMEPQYNELPVTDLVSDQRNEFSGANYRVLNFVVEVPLRVDRFMTQHVQLFRELGPIIFGVVEFQLVDKVTAQKNESGDNRHAMYKGRQKQRVKKRLEAGRRRGERPQSQLPLVIENGSTTTASQREQTNSGRDRGEP
jgi:uncharacterized protein (TIGR04552 family)